MVIDIAPEYPRPQLVRRKFLLLDVRAGFAHDDGNTGLRDSWHQRPEVFDKTIQLPFAPETAASGIAKTEYHPVVWYRIPFRVTDLEADTGASQLLLHCGGVDHSAQIWVNGTHVGSHQGGQTAFTIDITAALGGAGMTSDDEHILIIRAEDDPLDVAKPRGKQDWLPEPHAIWYHRATGIWRSIWLEAVPVLHIANLTWLADIPSATVTLDIELSHRPSTPTQVTVELSYEDVSLAHTTTRISEQRQQIVMSLPAQRNGQGYEELLWSPENPRLIAARIDLASTTGEEEGSDRVTSYLGIRSTAVEGGYFVLNDRPYYLRSVLEQGYWPDSHFTPPSVEAMRAEVQLIKDLGFNAVRIHQKVEDPRFLAWCDRLGLLVWGETASCYEFSPTAIQRMTTEWIEIIRRDISHPCIVTWVPLNESWGVQHIGHEVAQQHYGRALVGLTKSLDPTRPVISNDGWEHIDSDIISIHDYTSHGDEIRNRYGSDVMLAASTSGTGPAGRRVCLDNRAISSIPNRPGAPIMLTEFGGVKFDSLGDASVQAWGYSVARTTEEFHASLADLIGAAHDATGIMVSSRSDGRAGIAGPIGLAGFCYTQLTDTAQELNGLTDGHRVPKLPIEALRTIIEGTTDFGRAVVRRADSSGTPEIATVFE